MAWYSVVLAKYLLTTLAIFTTVYLYSIHVSNGLVKCYAGHIFMEKPYQKNTQMASSNHIYGLKEIDKIKIFIGLLMKNKCNHRLSQTFSYVNLIMQQL